MHNGQLRVGVIGVGHLGKHHARIYSQLASEQNNIELTAVVDVHADRAAEIAAHYRAEAVTDYRALIGKVDAVSLAVPTTDHARIGVELLENGIDVLVEKPIASSIEESQKLIDAAARSNRVLQV